MNIENDTQKTPRCDSAQKFWKRLEGRSHFPLYFPSKDSPLDWRDSLIWSALAYHGRLAKSKATYAKLAEMTGVYRETVAKIAKKLQGHGLMGEDLRVIEPSDPRSFFVLKGKTPLERTWTDKLVYSWYYILDDDDSCSSLQPFDGVMMALLVGRRLEATTVSYLATCLGCERKTVSASLDRLSGHGLAVEAGPLGIAIAYEKFLPSPTIFRSARKAAKRREADPVAYPHFLVQAVTDGKIPESYLGKLADWVEKSSDHLFPYDWTHSIIGKCWQEHQSLKVKKGVPYPALQFLGETANRIWNLRASIPTCE